MSTLPRFNISELEDHDFCPEYHHNRWMLQQVGIMDESEPLRLGTYAHKVLERMMRGEKPSFTAKLLASERALDLALAAWWGKLGIAHPWDAVLETEQALELEVWSPELGQAGFVLFGTPDACVTWEGKLWHLQHKTIGQSIPVGVFSAGIAQSLHEAGYAALLQHAHPGIPYGGTLLNIVRRLSEKRALEDPSQALHIEFLAITPAQIERGLRDISHKAQQILAQTRRYRRRAACWGIYRNKLCEYYPSCWQGISINDAVLFEHKNPLSHYATEEEAS